jgi:hypothetical protein
MSNETVAKDGGPDAAINRLVNIRYVLAGLQELRNAAELCGDADDVALYGQAIQLVMQTLADEAVEAAPAVDGAMQAAAPSGSLRKSGATFSGKNASAMHGVIKALAQLMAEAGDSQAGKVIAAYMKDDDGNVEAAAKVAKSAGDAIGTAVAPLQTLMQKVADSVAQIEQRVAAIEAQPMPGGPAARPVEKQIAGQAQQRDERMGQLAKLRQLAATEPDPRLRMEYNRQMMAAEQGLARQ